MLRADFAEDVLGDLEEDFYLSLETKPILICQFLYWYQTFNYLRPFAIKATHSTPYNHITMFRHNIRLSYRMIMKQKLFSAIEIGGFAVGIAACFLIALYIGNETQYDRHYSDKDRIYRLVNQWSEGGEVGMWSNVHGPLKEVLEDNIPEIEQVARVVLWSWGDAGENHIRPVESNYNYYEEGFFYADPELLSILEIPMIYGTSEEALNKPNHMVISRKKAQQYFPDENPVGRRMILNDNPETTFTIGGVMADFPGTSHLQGDFILTLFERKSGPGTSGWCCTNYNMYTKLKPQSDRWSVQEKTAALRNTFVLDQLRERGDSGIEEMQQYQSYYLQPIEDIYLNPEEVGDELRHGSTDLVWIFGTIAVIILVLACMNFINLSTARSIKRAKEVGVRKVVGSSRSILINQYLTESCFYSFLAVVLGILMVSIVLPYFNLLAGTSLTIPWATTWFIPLMLGSVLLIGVLSGIYPALYLSSFKPGEVLKGQVSLSRTSMLRSGMIVFQFTATVILLIGALVTGKQFDLIMNRSLGYEKEQVVNILGLDTMEKSEVETFKAELDRLSIVEHSSLSDYLPVEGSFVQNRSFWISDRRQLDNGFEAARWAVDEDYIPTMDMELVEGRNFRRGTADSRSIIINQAMTKTLGLEQPLGVKVIDMFDEEYEIIGVVQDFYFQSLFDHIQPLAMVHQQNAGTLSVRIASSDMATAMAEITDKWNAFQPNQLIRYSFMDQRFRKMYDGLIQAKTIFLIFSGSPS